MLQEEVIVIARLKAKPGMEGKLKEALLGLVAPTRGEAGAIRYELHEGLERSGEFMFYEVWRTLKDLEDHMATPHFKTFMERADALLSQPGDVSLWRKIA